jgi:hypothetical protein
MAVTCGRGRRGRNHRPTVGRCEKSVLLVAVPLPSKQGPEPGWRTFGRSRNALVRPPSAAQLSSPAVQRAAPATGGPLVDAPTIARMAEAPPPPPPADGTGPPRGRGERGRFVARDPLGGPAGGVTRYRGSRNTLESRKKEFDNFLRLFLLPGDKSDWVPYTQSAHGPLVKLYETIVHSTFRIGKGTRATMSRVYHFDGLRVPTDKLPRRNIVDPESGLRGRSRLFPSRRLPRPDELIDGSTPIRSWIEALHEKRRMLRSWGSVSDCVEAVVTVLRTYKESAHGRGYVGYPPIEGAEEPGVGPGDGQATVIDQMIGRAFTAMLTPGGGRDVRVDDAVKEIRALLGRVGEQGVVGSDEIADALEEACGQDAFRVDIVGFRKAFHALVVELGLSLPRELPKVFGVCFLAAAQPAVTLGSRVAARVLVKVWKDVRGTDGFEGVEDDQEPDVKEVRAIIQGHVEDSTLDEVGVEAFEKAARQVLFSVGPDDDDKRS